MAMFTNMPVQLGVFMFSLSSVIILWHQSRRKYWQAVKATPEAKATAPSLQKKRLTLSQQHVKEAIASIESLVQQDEGKRGIGQLLQPSGELWKCCELIAKASSVAIITGFPCMIDHSPPTETDGPLGALALAKALVGQDKDVHVLTDECNEEVLLACSAAAHIDHRMKISLQSFPPKDQCDELDWTRLEHIVEEVQLVIAIERAGPSKDGRYLTMRCRDMTNIIAPLDILLTAQSPRMGRPLYSIGIGDGGNEVGMGKAYAQIINSSIPNGAEIACTVSADELLVASVSNWGGYALSAASVLYHSFKKLQAPSDVTTGMIEASALRKQLHALLPTDEEEIAKCQRMVEAGARDGITGECALMVDGMPLQASLDILQRLRDIV
jgi:hypothetical protein